jgi:hypothetical protein
MSHEQSFLPGDFASLAAVDRLKYLKIPWQMLRPKTTSQQTGFV